MPQMSPLPWLYLMLMFIMGYVFFFSFTYFVKSVAKTEKSFEVVEDYMKDWKW